MLIGLLGLFSGALMGLTGGGGAIVSIPILIYGLHIPMAIATTLSLLVVGCSALVGTVIRRKEIYWRKGIVFAILGSVAAPLGVFAAKYFNEILLIGCFAILMLVVAAIMVKKSLSVQEATVVTNLGSTNSWQEILNILPIALFTGFLTGLFGVGGGFMIVPALVLFGKIDNKAAVATSLFTISLISMTSILTKITHVDLDLMLTSLFVAGGIIGIMIGSYFAKKISNKLTQRSFALVAATLGVYMMFDSITRFMH